MAISVIKTNDKQLGSFIANSGHDQQLVRFRVGGFISDNTSVVFKPTSSTKAIMFSVGYETNRNGIYAVNTTGNNSNATVTTLVNASGITVTVQNDNEVKVTNNTAANIYIVFMVFVGNISDN